MIDTINEFFRSVLGNDYLTLYVISIIPIIELRGALVFMAGMTDVMASFKTIVCGMLCCVAGSTTVIVPIILITRPLLRKLKETKLFANMAKNAEHSLSQRAEEAYSEEKASQKHKKLSTDTKKFLGLFAFVAIPLPMTGAWTGACVGSFLDFKIWKASLAVFLGNIVAAIILTALGYFLQDYASVYLYGFVVLAIVLAVALSISRARKKEKEKKAEMAKYATTNDYELAMMTREANEEGRQLIKKEYIDENGDKHIIIGNNESLNEKFNEPDDEI